MKRAAPFLFVACATLAHADPVDPLLFEERVRLAKEAESTEPFKTYPHRMFKRAGRYLARTMRSCIAASPKPEAKAFVLVADISAAGKADAVAVKPDNEVARCFAAEFSSLTFLKPPAYPGREGFPVTIKIAVSH